MDMSENEDEDDHDMNDETIKDKLKHYVEKREHENVEDSHKSTVNQDFNESFPSSGGILILRRQPRGEGGGQKNTFFTK